MRRPDVYAMLMGSWRQHQSCLSACRRPARVISVWTESGGRTRRQLGGTARLREGASAAIEEGRMGGGQEEKIEGEKICWMWMLGQL